MSTARTRAAAVLAAVTVTTSTLTITATSALAPAPATAAVTGTVEGGTATWGLSTYLGSATMGRPNPLASAYAAPSTFDSTTRLSTWGAGTGLVAGDGSADLAFTGTTVNFASTSGAWLRLSGLQADLDASGNGTVSAVVEYGLAPGTFPGITYDPTQAPQRGPLRVDLVDLAGNTAADAAITPTAATWTGLDGTWSPELTAFLAGDPTASPAVPAWVYAGQVNGNADRTPLPFTFSVATEAPSVTAEVTDASYGDGVTIAVAGDGFRGVTQPGDAGVYVGLAPSGGLPDVSSIEGMGAFAAADYRPMVPGGALTSTLVAATSELDPTEDYSVYTWQAHRHSNTSQDTETPVEIDWAALEPQASTVTAAGPTTRTYGAHTAVAASVPGPGSVVLTGLGAEQTADVVDGAAVFAVPPTLPVGTHTATLTYSGGGDYAGSSTTRTLTVTKATPRTVLTIVRKPTAGPRGKTGAAKVAVIGPSTVAKPTGKVTVRLTRPGAKAKVVTRTLRAGQATLTLPRVVRGAWTATATYAGNASFAEVAQAKRFTVR